MWFTDATSSRVGAIAPDGTLAGPFSTSSPAATPTGIARGPDGNLWYVDEAANAIERITTAGAVTSFSLGALGANVGPLEIALGPNGQLYFTEANHDRIGRIDPLAGSNAAILASLVQTAVVPSGDGAGAAGLMEIAPGPDGQMWFTEAAANRVGSVSRDLSTINEFGVGISPSSTPSGIAAGPDGALWFSEKNGSRIGRITTAGAVSEFALPAAGRAPTAIALGPDAALWFSETSAAQIGRIDPQSHAVSEFPLTAGSAPEGIVAGPDGALWFTEFGRDRIGRLALTSPTPPVTVTVTVALTPLMPPSTPTQTAPAPTPAPQLSGAKLSRAVFAAESRGASLAVRTKRGTDVSYRDSQAATTTFTVFAASVGHRKGASCLAGRPTRHEPGCTRYVSLGSFTHDDRAGNVKVHFTGRLAARKLKPGRYLLALTPRANGASGRTVRLSFRVVA